MCGGSISMKNIFVLWIDDENREEDATNKSYEIDDLNILWISPNDFINNIESMYNINNLNNNKKPDLFLIDYYLNHNATADGDKFTRKGISVAGEVLEHFPNVPIYGISNLEELSEKISPSALEIFDKILPMTDFEDNGDKILYNDAYDYWKLNLKNLDIGRLVNLLKVPKQSLQDIAIVLPKQELPTTKKIDKYFDGKKVSRWIQNTLLKYPGPLYDDLYLSTYLGIHISELPKISKVIKSSQYNGIFSKSMKKNYWWMSDVKNRIYKLRKDDDYNLYPWDFVPIKFKIKKVSKCAVCNKRYPETVGIFSGGVSERKPVHIHCSKPSDKIMKKLHFEEIREFDLD